MKNLINKNKNYAPKQDGPPSTTKHKIKTTMGRSHTTKHMLKTTTGALVLRLLLFGGKTRPRNPNSIFFNKKN